MPEYKGAFAYVTKELEPGVLTTYCGFLKWHAIFDLAKQTGEMHIRIGIDDNGQLQKEQEALQNAIKRGFVPDKVPTTVS